MSACSSRRRRRSSWPRPFRPSVELEVPASAVLRGGRRARPPAIPGLEEHAFPTLLRLRARPRARRRACASSPARSATGSSPARGPRARSHPQIVWAALDCPGAIAVGFPERGETLLGRFAVADRASCPQVGERCVVRRLAARRGRPEALCRDGALRRGRPACSPAPARPGSFRGSTRCSRIAFRSFSTISSARADQVLDVVVLGVDVAAGERVGSSRGEHAHELRRELGRRPRHVVVRSGLVISVCTSPGLKTKTGIRPRSSFGERLAVAAHRRLARRVRRARRSPEGTRRRCR